MHELIASKRIDIIINLTNKGLINNKWLEFPKLVKLQPSESIYNMCVFVCVL